MKYLLPLVLLCVTGFLAGCGHQPASPPPALLSDNAEPTEAQPKLPTMKIYLGPEVLDTELALTSQQMQVGMMFRTNIQDADSMLFVLPVPQRADFWMENCPESISAAYITANGTIAEIHHLEKEDTNSVYSATDNIQFVLETSDGWFARHHIPVGTMITTEKGSLAQTFLSGR